MKKLKSTFRSKYPFIIILSSIISFSFTTLFEKGDIKIYWSKDKLLTWDDFNGKPAKSSAYDADTDAGFELHTSYKSDARSIVIELQAYFLKNKSCVKQDKKTDYLLKHEQEHFDISEIHARKFRKNLMEEKFKEKTFSKKLNELNSKYTNEQFKYQQLYDKESDHSRNEKKQLEWDVKIAKDLKELDKYSEPNFTVEVK